MILETERLILRPWLDTDAEDLFLYASHPDVGPISGWPVHKTIEESRKIIATALAKPLTFAVVMKSTGHAVGSIGLKVGEESNLDLPEWEGEIGFWIGVPFWGQGLIPEAVRELLRYGFVDSHLEKIWCGYFDGNENSRRVQEKCGFQFVRTCANVPWPLMGDIRTEHISCLTKEDWEISVDMGAENQDRKDNGGAK